MRTHANCMMTKIFNYYVLAIKYYFLFACNMLLFAFYNLHNFEQYLEQF